MIQVLLFVKYLINYYIPLVIFLLFHSSDFCNENDWYWQLTMQKLVRKKRISVAANTVKQRQLVSTECFIFAIWITAPFFFLFEDIFVHEQMDLP